MVLFCGPSAAVFGDPIWVCGASYTFRSANLNFRLRSGELPAASPRTPRPALVSFSCTFYQVNCPVSRNQGLSHLDLTGRHGSPMGLFVSDLTPCLIKLDLPSIRFHFYLVTWREDVLSLRGGRN